MTNLMKSRFLVLFFILNLFAFSCSDDEDEIVEPLPEQNTEIQDFIWQGLNLWYFWQADVPNLADNKFTTTESYENFLKTEEDPESFFYNLLYDRTNSDKWSWIVDDYIELENSFQGISKSNGVEFGLTLLPNNDVYGYVRYILPNSDASNKPIKRGDLFTKVNGKQLTLDNYRTLLFGTNDIYTLSLAKIENNTIVPTNVDVTLTQVEYTENPVYIAKVIPVGGKKIGYLMYNGFTSNFDKQLNDAFLLFKNEGITDLVLDVRYNPGGSVRTAISLAGMVTGQYKDQLFTKERWNNKLQAEFEKNYPDYLVNNFTDKLANGNQINSLNLNKLHVITSRSSASASELVVSGLQPYITVKLVGDKTVGKYVASVTLYDSEDFGRKGANPNHKYAMQPIVLEEINKVGGSSKGGLIPDIELKENHANLGILGDVSEPLLDAAISDITGLAKKAQVADKMVYDHLTDSKMMTPTSDNMYIEKKELGKIFLEKKFFVPVK